MIKYEIDWKENANAWKRSSEKQEALKVCKKLARHFKLGDVDFRFDKNKNGSACGRLNYIRLPRKNILLGLITHEIAHLVAYNKFGNCHHDKKFMRYLKQVNNYAKKKFYFDNFVKWTIKLESITFFERTWTNPTITA